MSIPSKITIYQGNDQFIEISGLTEGLTGVNVITAVVTATLKDRTGTVVPGIENLPLSYIAGTPSTYRGPVEDTIVAATGGGYTLELRAVMGSTVGFWKIKAEIKIRRT